MRCTFSRFVIAAPHSRNELARVRVAVDEDGTIHGITADSQCDVGAYPAAGSPMDFTLLPGPYKIPRLGFSAEMTWSNTMGKGPYRGPWMFETTAREMMLDIVARRLGMDPVELRRRNILRASDLPFTSPGLKEFQEITPGETLEQALEMRIAAAEAALPSVSAHGGWARKYRHLLALQGRWPRPQVDGPPSDSNPIDN